MLMVLSYRFKGQLSAWSIKPVYPTALRNIYPDVSYLITLQHNKTRVSPLFLDLLLLFSHATGNYAIIYLWYKFKNLKRILNLFIHSAYIWFDNHFEFFPQNTVKNELFHVTHTDKPALIQSTQFVLTFKKCLNVIFFVHVTE